MAEGPPSSQCQNSIAALQALAVVSSLHWTGPLLPDPQAAAQAPNPASPEASTGQYRLEYPRLEYPLSLHLSAYLHLDLPCPPVKHIKGALVAMAATAHICRLILPQCR